MSPSQPYLHDLQPLANLLAEASKALLSLPQSISVPSSSPPPKVPPVSPTDVSVISDGDRLASPESKDHARRTLVALKAQIDATLVVLDLHEARESNAKLVINSLPPEILAIIIDYARWATDDSPRYRLRLPESPFSRVLNFSWVCSHWRTICRGHSAFWTSLEITAVDQTGRLMSLLPLAGSRSIRLSTAPFEVPEDTDTPCISIPSDGLDRITELSLGRWSHLKIFDLPVNAVLDNVHTLSIVSDRWFQSQGGPIRFGRESAVPLRGVRRLTLGERACLDDMANLTDLTLLELETVSAAETLASLRMIRLERLELRFPKFLRIPDDTEPGEIQYPLGLQSLKELAVVAKLPTALADWFTAHPFVKLERLTFIDLNELDGVNTLLDSVPGVKYIHLKGRPRGPIGIIQQIIPPDDLNDPAPFPDLTELTVEIMSQNRNSGVKSVELHELNDQLSLCLALRRERDMPNLARLTVSKCVVDACGNPGWLRRNVDELDLINDDETQQQWHGVPANAPLYDSD